MKERTGSRSFMDLGLVRESGGLVQKKGTGPLRSSSNVQNDIVQFNKWKEIQTQDYITLMNETYFWESAAI